MPKVVRTTKPRGKATTAKPRRRRRKGVLTAGWSALSALLVVLFVAVEGTFLLVGMILSLVITALSALAELLPDDDRVTAQPSRSPKVAQTRGSTAKRAAGPIIRCTATGKPVDECRCAARHVRTADGARRYGGRVGAPIVTGKKP